MLEFEEGLAAQNAFAMGEEVSTGGCWGSLSTAPASGDEHNTDRLFGEVLDWLDGCDEVNLCPLS